MGQPAGAVLSGRAALRQPARRIAPSTLMVMVLTQALILLAVALAGVLTAGGADGSGGLAPVRWLVRQRFGGPFGTSDAFLGTPDDGRASAAVSSALAGVPPSQPLLFVGPVDDHLSFERIYYTV